MPRKSDMYLSEQKFRVSEAEGFLASRAREQLEMIDAWTKGGEHQLIAEIVRGELKPDSKKVIKYAKKKIQESILNALAWIENEAGRADLLGARAIEMKFIPALRSRLAERETAIKAIDLADRLLACRRLDEEGESLILEHLHEIAKKRGAPRDIRNMAFRAFISAMGASALSRQDAVKIIEMYRIVRDEGHLKVQREAARDAIERIREAGEARFRHDEFMKALKPPEKHPNAKLRR
ncbi:MAG: hypothetical protein AB1295_03660 [Candidatus Micrarchaeota archaeon]